MFFFVYCLLFIWFHEEMFLLCMYFLETKEGKRGLELETWRWGAWGAREAGLWESELECVCILSLKWRWGELGIYRG